MAYTAWSVVFGEQPTAAKWNQLGTNDAGFKDGTNIDNDAIIKRHLANAAIGTAELDFTDFDVYSASETDTGRKYVDGRTIYRKVLRGTLNVAVGANNIAHGITGITNLEILRVDGNIVLSSAVRGNSVNLLWHRETGGNWANPTAMNNTNFTWTSSFAWGNSVYTIIIEYVK